MMNLVECFRNDGILKKENQIKNDSLLQSIYNLTDWIDNPSFSQRIWHIQNNINHAVLCSNGNSRNFISLREGYRTVCSVKGCLCKKHQLSEDQKKSFSEKKNKTMMTRYNKLSKSSEPEVKEKIRLSKSKIENIESWKTKMMQTMIDRHGTHSMLTHSEIRQKGLDAQNSAEFRDRKKSIFKEKYGFSNPMQVPEFQEKARETNILKYGFSNPMQVPEFQEKARDTNINRYGTSNPMQAHSKDSFLKLQDIEFWESIDDMNSLRKIIPDVSHTSLLHYAHKFKSEIISKGSISFPHQKILDIISECNFEVNTRKIITPYELDCWIPEKNLAIEINGLFWHSEYAGNKSKNYHLQKLQLCKEKGIRLFQFWDSEIQQKFPIIQSMINHQLKPSHLINARDCKIFEIPSNLERDFFQENHLQGFCSSKICFGLFFEDQLLSAMSFGKSRFNKKFDYELLRYASAPGFLIRGGASKLFSRRPSGSILSYADRRYSEGNLYHKLGFKLLHYSDPGYYYTRDYYSLIHRSNFMKKDLINKLSSFDASQTEWQNMRNNGYDRVWDCGQSVWGHE